MNTLFLNARNNNNENGNEVIELIPIITFPIVATFVLQKIAQILLKASHLLIKIYNEEIVLHIIAALIAAEIVYILTLIMEHAFNKVDRLITKLKEDNKEKDKVIIKLLQKEDTKEKEKEKEKDL